MSWNIPFQRLQKYLLGYFLVNKTYLDIQNGSLHWEPASPSANLARGHIGRETILWTEQIVIFDKKLLIYAFKPIWHNFLYKIQHINFFEEASGLFLSINWEKWPENIWRGNVVNELRPPLGLFLEWLLC